MILHLLGVTGAVVIPVLLSPVLPEAAQPVHAFFVEPLDVPAPPLPPSPPAPHAAARPAAQATPAATTAFTAPLEVARELKPEEWLDLGTEDGTSGGVDGGVPGGVLGAIVGGLPAATAEAPVPAPVRVSGLVKEPVKLVHVEPVYPPVAVAGHVQGVVVIDALIDQRGRVVETTIVRGHPIFEKAAVEAVRQWVYTPTLLDGVPVRVLMTITVSFRLTS
jgi:protein TonB